MAKRNDEDRNASGGKNLILTVFTTLTVVAVLFALGAILLTVLTPASEASRVQPLADTLMGLCESLIFGLGGLLAGVNLRGGKE